MSSSPCAHHPASIVTDIRQIFVWHCFAGHNQNRCPGGVCFRVCPCGLSETRIPTSRPGHRRPGVQGLACRGHLGICPHRLVGMPHWVTPLEGFLMLSLKRSLTSLIYSRRFLDRETAKLVPTTWLLDPLVGVVLMESSLCSVRVNGLRLAVSSLSSHDLASDTGHVRLRPTQATSFLT